MKLYYYNAIGMSYACIIGKGICPDTGKFTENKRKKLKQILL